MKIKNIKLENAFKTKAWAASALLLITAVVWGSGFVVCQICYDEGASPMLLLAGRFLVACLFMDIFFIKIIMKLSRDLIRSGCIIGLFLFIAFTFQNYGLKYSSPSVCAFVTSIYVVLVPIFSWVKYKRRPGFFAIFASVLAVTGVALFSVTENLSISFGALLTFVSAVVYAFQVMSIEYYTKKHSPLALTIVMINFTALLSGLVVIGEAVTQGAVPDISPRGLIALVYLGLTCTAFCFLGQSIGQKYVSASRASVILSVESIFGALFSVLLLNELFTGKMFIGAVVIFISVLMSELGSSISGSK